MLRRTQTWLGYQIDLPTALGAALFSWLAWGNLTDPGPLTGQRLLIILFDWAVALLFFYWLWQGRKPRGFQVGRGKEE